MKAETSGIERGCAAGAARSRNGATRRWYGRCYHRDVAPPSGPVDYIDVTRDSYAALGFSAYRWVTSAEPTPFTRPRKPLRDSRIALIASGGIYVAGQIAFHFKDDTSFRL